jgi:hypothetical protein
MTSDIQYLGTLFRPSFSLLREVRRLSVILEGSNVEAVSVK